ncbi:MAG: arsenite methyltransferase [Chitinophagales bacterium]
MENNEKIKEQVRETYTEIALQERSVNASSCCGATSCCGAGDSLMAEDYSQLKGYNPDADLGLGCGLPTQFAKIEKGDVVIDLGSGAGNDCFVARAETGEEGKVIGIDMTGAMISKARANAEKLGFHNVEFRLGEIENLPVSSSEANVIVSNCVLNLVPDKEKAFAEIYRVLKPGGHFSISDIVLDGTFPDKILNAAEMYAGCVSGAIQKSTYLNIIADSGFENMVLQKEKLITVPNDILAEYLSAEEIATYQKSGTGIYSITVYAEKKKTRPEKNEAACCDKTVCCQ